MRTYPVTPPVTAIGAVTQILNEVEEGRIIPTSTHALATHIVQSLCAHEWVVDYSGMVFKSNPPKRARHCLICGKNDSVIAHDERCMGECSKCQGADICGDVGGYCAPCEGECMSWAGHRVRTRPQYEPPYLVKETQAVGIEPTMYGIECPWRQQMLQEGHFNEQELGSCNNDPDECGCQWVSER